MDPNQHNQVIIFKNNDDDGKRHFTWSDYCHFTYAFKYWVLGITLVFAIIGYLLISLWWNDNHMRSTARVDLDMPMQVQKDDNGNTTAVTYLDGTSYSMYDIISVGNMQAVIDDTLDEEGNKVYGKLDAAKMAKDNVLSIALQTKADSNGATQNVDQKEFAYVITAKTGYFSDEEELNSFVDALLDNILKSALSHVPDEYLSSDIPDNYASMSYGTLIAMLQSQYDRIDEFYQGMIELYSGSKVIVDSQGNARGTLQSAYINGFQADYQTGSTSRNTIDVLEQEFNANHYIRLFDDDPAQTLEEVEGDGESLQMELANVSDQVAFLMKMIDNISNALSSQENTASSGLNALLEEYILSFQAARTNLEDIVDELEYLGYVCETEDSIHYTVTLATEEKDYGVIQYLQNADPTWLEDCRAFATKLDDSAKKLVASLDTANGIYKDVSTSNTTSVTYADQSHFVTDGKVSPVLGAAAGLIVGFVLSSVCLAAYGYIKDKDGIPVLVEGKPLEDAKVEKKDEQSSEEKKDCKEEKE